MFGSDWPFANARVIAEAVKHLRRRDVSRRRNAARSTAAMPCRFFRNSADAYMMVAKPAVTVAAVHSRPAMTQIRHSRSRCDAVRASSACTRSTASISRCPTSGPAQKFYSSFRARRARSGQRARHPHPRPSASLGIGGGGAAQEAAIHLVRRVRGRPAALSRAARCDCASRASTRRPGAQSNGIWLRDPDGTPIEIRVAEKVLAEREVVVRHGFERPRACRARRAAARSRRCGRAGSPICWSSPATSRKAIRFYGEVLGLRLSDRSGDMIAFMHGIHGSDHHMIAFVKSDGPGLHHLSWDVRLDQRHRHRRHADGGQGFYRRLGTRAATCSDRTTSTTCAIPGEATPSTPPISTTFRSITTGRAADHPAGGFLLRLGPDAAAGFRVQLRSGALSSFMPDLAGRE